MTDLYFFILTAINLFVLVFMCVLVQLSETLNPKQTRGFLFTFILIGGISILEMISVLVDDGPVWLRAVNILSNYLGFGLTPAVPLCLVYTMERSEHMKGSLRVAIGIEVFYFVVLTVSLFSKGLVFSVDAATDWGAKTARTDRASLIRFIVIPPYLRSASATKGLRVLALFLMVRGLLTLGAPLHRNTMRKQLWSVKNST